MLFDYVLQSSLNELNEEGIIKSFSIPEAQKVFRTDSASDVFDHFCLITKQDDTSLEIWGQTTCYKGNSRGAKEANKTYEIRETLVEALNLGANRVKEGIEARVIHFTIGDPEYSYGWIKPMRDMTFDLSLYLSDETDFEAIYGELESILDTCVSDQDRFRAFERIEGEQTPLAESIQILRHSIIDYIKADTPRKSVTTAQISIVSELMSRNEPRALRAIHDSKKGGLGIKERTSSVIRNPSQNEEPLIFSTVSKVLSKKPFVSEAINAIHNWQEWSEKTFDIPNMAGLSDYIRYLWQSDLPERHVVRRLLLRVHNLESEDNYLQDVYINGLDERNLYPGEHSNEQVNEIVEKIVGRLENSKLQNPEDLQDELKSTRALNAVRKSFRREVSNGTSLRPSFDYLQLALADIYDFVKFKDAGLEKPIGYQSSFAVKVGAYENLLVAIRKFDRKPIAIVKGKFFSSDEWPRRAKEEAYVSLTVLYTYDRDSETFIRRYRNLPLIMFADTPPDYVPPEFAIRRLSHFGWNVFTDINSLRDFLKSLENSEENDDFWN